MRNLIISALVVGLWACGEDRAGPPALPSLSLAQTQRTPDSPAIDPRILQKFQRDANADALPTRITQAMINLGRVLWYDERLSATGDVSCNTCHNLEQYGVDGLRTSIGVDRIPGRRNAPTVYNASAHFAQFWDGRRKTVEQQALDPLLDKHEMGMTETSLVERIMLIPGYLALFESAFPAATPAVSVDNIAAAVGAFERGLITPSRWHRFLAGEAQALSAVETEGLRVFLEIGCTGCHTGPQIGASMFQRLGLVTPWPNQEDRGRFEITGEPTDAMVFKVPSLLNVSRTAPYFHDGSISELPSAVRVMARHQLGIQLDEQRIDAIVTFLDALTGEIPVDYIARPALPGEALAQR